MPARPKFSREQLQAAALAIVDERGLAALSMRSLADALGTGAMTIYNYVRNRDELDALVVEAVLAKTRWPDHSSGDWRQDVRAIAEALWQAVRNHPAVIPLVLTRRSLHDTTLACAEALLEALAASGRSGMDLLVAFRTVMGFVMGLAQAQLAGPLSADDDRVSAVTIRQMQALAPERFPRLVEVADAAARGNTRHEFDAGIDIILAGLASSSPSHR